MKCDGDIHFVVYFVTAFEYINATYESAIQKIPVMYSTFWVNNVSILQILVSLFAF